MKAKTLKTLIDPFPIVIMIIFRMLSLIINIIYDDCSTILWLNLAIHKYCGYSGSTFHSAPKVYITYLGNIIDDTALCVYLCHNKALYILYHWLK